MFKRNWKKLTQNTSWYTEREDAEGNAEEMEGRRGSFERRVKGGTFTGGTFKARYNKYQSDMRNVGDQHNTCLSKYIWKLKRENKKGFFDVKLQPLL